VPQTSFIFVVPSGHFPARDLHFGPFQQPLQPPGKTLSIVRFYQIGIRLAASTPTVEFALRDRLGYPWALTSFELIVIAGLALLLGVGREDHGKSFLRQSSD
jgi:hypothetical protein